jgi:protein-S-isoprenylcysteine O-methyltransferase Ste14
MSVPESVNAGLPAPPVIRAVAALGGIVFVAALAAGAWRFLALGTPPARGPVLPGVLINIALFGVFALHHSVLASDPVKAWVARRLSPPLERPAYVWVASLLFLLVCVAWQPIAGTLYVIPPPWSWLAGAVQLAGGILTFDAARRIDVRVLAGLRPDPGLQVGTGAASDAELVAAGGYRLVRHPIYLGWVLLVWAASDMTLGRFAFAAISTAYLVLAVPFEERSLLRRFGPGYAAYAARVRWRIVPGLY